MAMQNPLAQKGQQTQTQYINRIATLEQTKATATIKPFQSDEFSHTYGYNKHGLSFFEF